MKRACSDLSILWWGVLPPLVMIAVVVGHYFSPPLYEIMTVRDEINPYGIIENATILVMLPAIVAGFIVFARRSALPHWTTGWVALACALACVYFAGEEASWGQHYFGWETGERMSDINKQKETNLHNVSTWFNQKPRMVVEWWLLIGGIILPLWRTIRKSAPDPKSFSHWFWPTDVVVPTALLYLALRCAYWYQNATEAVIPYWTYDPETREYYIALFLSLYLLSMWSRMNSVLRASRMETVSQPTAPASAANPSAENTSPNQLA